MSASRLCVESKRRRLEDQQFPLNRTDLYSRSPWPARPAARPAVRPCRRCPIAVAAGCGRCACVSKLTVAKQNTQLLFHFSTTNYNVRQSELRQGADRRHHPRPEAAARTRTARRQEWLAAAEIAKDPGRHATADGGAARCAAGRGAAVVGAAAVGERQRCDAAAAAAAAATTRARVRSARSATRRCAAPEACRSWQLAAVARECELDVRSPMRRSAVG